MNFRINSAWSSLGARLTLVALYLFLANSKAAATLFKSGSNALGSTLAVLQGRNASVGARK